MKYMRNYVFMKNKIMFVEIRRLLSYEGAKSKNN